MSKETKNKDYINPYNDERIITAQDVIDSGVEINRVPTRSGLFNTTVNRTKFFYNTPGGAVVRENEGAYIVMGQVPMGASETSGYGALGLPADTIDLVVGRGAGLNKGKGPKEGEVVNNNHMADAARIYICRLTDVDKEFNIESDSATDGSPTPRSAVAVKADQVRLIGREGVKIVTGKVFTPTGGAEKNSRGGEIAAAPKIDLIAGNNYGKVQGVALGERTSDCLLELNQIVGEIWSAVFNLSLLQAGFNGVVGVTHPFTPWIAGAMPPTNMGIYNRVLNSLYQTRTTASLWELNYLKWHGKQYIVSTNVRTN